MATPVAFCNATVGALANSITASVTSATAAGDDLFITVGMGGNGSPTVTGVTDTQGNTYTLLQSSTSLVPFLYVYAATGAGTKALAITDTVTASFSGATASGAGIIGSDCPGVGAIDVSATPVSGVSTSPSVSGTPAQPGEIALASFTWSNPGGTGTVQSPFTQLAQNHIASNAYTTVAYDVNPPSGSALSASYTIAATAWRAILITAVPTASVFTRNASLNQAVMRAAVW